MIAFRPTYKLFLAEFFSAPRLAAFSFERNHPELFGAHFWAFQFGLFYTRNK